MAELRSAALWHEILVVDDGSTDDTVAQAEAAGARVIRHPYNKGNGAAVKTGIRHAGGRYVLIIDADGQHQPADAARLVARLTDHELVVGARSAHSHAGLRRAPGQLAVECDRGLSGRPPDSRSDVWLSCRSARTASGVPASAAERLLDADDNDPRVLESGLQRLVRADRGGTARRAVEDQARHGRPRFFLILLKVITIFSPLRIFLPMSAAAFVSAPRTPCGRSPRSRM